ncbi:transposase [Streptomyces phaeochromogenes]|uniref:transposase n=1 Tax=Streptomyces phaeochromogenes TaxID=1923 RepID=UPI00369BD12A
MWRARIEPLLPDLTPKRGGRSRDHREVIEAIAFESRTGMRWIHLPGKYEPHVRGYRPKAVPCGSTARHRRRPRRDYQARHGHTVDDRRPALPASALFTAKADKSRKPLVNVMDAIRGERAVRPL